MAGEMAQQLRTLAACKGHKFSFQHPHGSSQPSVVTVPGDLINFSGLLGYCVQVVHFQTSR